MKNIKIIIALVGIIATVLLNNVCFGGVFLYTGADGYVYHFSGKGSHSMTIYFGGNGSNPEYSDDVGGNITVKNAGVYDEPSAKKWIKDNHYCDNYTMSHIASNIIKFTCNGHGDNSKILEYNGKKYHFSKNVVTLPGEVANTENEAKTWALNHHCDNAEITKEHLYDHTGRDVYTVKCNGHDELADYTTEFGEGFDPSLIPNGNVVHNVKITTNKIAGTTILILQMLTVAGVIITGIRYMFSTGDVKSEIKKTLPFLIIGIIIVFAGPIIINFILEVADEIM